MRGIINRFCGPAHLKRRFKSTGSSNGQFFFYKSAISRAITRNWTPVRQVFTCMREKCCCLFSLRAFNKSGCTYRVNDPWLSLSPPLSSECHVFANAFAQRVDAFTDERTRRHVRSNRRKLSSLTAPFTNESRFNEHPFSGCRVAVLASSPLLVPWATFYGVLRKYLNFNRSIVSRSGASMRFVTQRK